MITKMTADPRHLGMSAGHVCPQTVAATRGRVVVDRAFVANATTLPGPSAWSPPS